VQNLLVGILVRCTFGHWIEDGIISCKLKTPIGTTDCSMQQHTQNPAYHAHNVSAKHVRSTLLQKSLSLTNHSPKQVYKSPVA
jgi:hypothetical protein